MTKGATGAPFRTETTLGLEGRGRYFLVVFLVAAAFLTGAAFFMAPGFS
jgi:hypothetical protein